MKYILAVSGGVDSVALLDMVVKDVVSLSSAEYVVAHFDHGIRENSDWDARFCWELAKKHKLPFEVRRENLGKKASEALARERRYKFLREVAAKYDDATIITAHHQDDLLETIAINVKRGTGWRGLAPMKPAEVIRPLLGKTKQELRDYALQNNLEWLEDETNVSDAYLRNRLRRKLQARLTPDRRAALLKLWESQTALRAEIEPEIKKKLPSMPYSRYFFIMLPQSVALELLANIAGGALTRPQCQAWLLAIKTARPHTTTQLGGGLQSRNQLRDFIVETTPELL